MAAFSINQQLETTGHFSGLLCRNSAGSALAALRKWKLGIP
jgi:hypothetical protein